MKEGRPEHCKGCVNFLGTHKLRPFSKVGGYKPDLARRPNWCCAKGDVVHRSIGWCITYDAKVNANTGK